MLLSGTADDLIALVEEQGMEAGTAWLDERGIGLRWGRKPAHLRRKRCCGQDTFDRFTFVDETAGADRLS